MRLLFRLVLIVVVLGVLAVGGAVAAFHFAPSDTIKQYAAETVLEETGRELTIEGEIERTLFPVLGVKTGAIRVSNASWSDDPEDMFTVDALEVGLDPMALVGGVLRVVNLDLTRPNIRLEVSEGGLGNWIMGDRPVGGGDGAQGGDGTSGGGGGGDGPPAVVIDNARITEGAVRFVDRRPGRGQAVEAEAIALTISLPALDQTLTLDGAATINGAPASVKGTLTSPEALQRGDLAQADLMLEAQGVAAGFDGGFRPPADGAAPEAKGTLTLKVSGDPAETEWLRAALPENLKDLGAVDIAGEIDAGPQALKVDIGGDLDVKRRTTVLKAAAEAGAGWFEGAAPVDVDVSAVNPLLDVGFVGVVGQTPQGAPLANGAYRLKSSDLQSALGWVDMGAEAESPMAKLQSADLNGQVDMGETGLSAETRGRVGFNERQVEIASEASAGAGWNEGAPIEQTVRVSSDGLFAVDWSGSTAIAPDGARVDGTIAFESGALRAFADWLGAGPLDAPDGKFETARFKGAVKTTPDSVAVTGIDMAIDDVTVAGSVSAEGLQDRPSIDLTLETGALDLRPFTAAARTAGGGGGSGGGASSGGGGGGSGGGWSEEPFELSVFNLIDATFDVSVAGLATDLVRLEASKLSGSLQGGALDVDLERIGLYGGAATGAINIITQGAPTYALNVDVAGVALRPLLIDFAGVSNIEGTGAFKTNVSGDAASMMSVMRSMDGDGSIRFTDGALLGYNLAALVRNITSLGTVSGDNQRTDFAEISGTYTIVDGVATNNDFNFLGPLIRATGAGTVDLGAQTLNYRLVPKAVASLKGQGGDATARGISFPLVISGPWANPSITPDLLGGGLPDVGSLGSVLEVPTDVLQGLEGGGIEDLLQGAGGGAGDVVRSITEGVGGLTEGDNNPVGGLVDGLLGDGGGDSGGGGGDGGGDGGGSSKPADLIKKLF